MTDVSKLPAITPEYLMELDAKTTEMNCVVWLTDGYLLMNGIQGRDEMYYYLEEVIYMKELMRSQGYEFKCDKI